MVLFALGLSDLTAAEHSVLPTLGVNHEDAAAIGCERFTSSPMPGSNQDGAGAVATGWVEGLSSFVTLLFLALGSL